mmetsp:Transcript_3678/g.5405  ORF Transcript_3678/g.5405 Transcript_3678/m.5405 type:complete len:238 (-) Transcript_3678:23-736(-)
MSNADNSNRRRPHRPQQQRETAASSVLIEDEQPHEFYADLVMLNNRTQRTNQIMPSSSSLLSNSVEANSNANVIQENEKEKDQNSDGSTPKSSSPTQSEFAKVFQRAVTNPPQFSKLLLDRANRGYQMLQNMGWKEKDGGLGRHRQGTLVPIPRTKVKNNQTGLGRKRKRMPRKNSTERNNETSNQTTVSRKSSTAKTKAEKKLHPQHQEAQQMKRIRMLLRTDVTDQYEDLYLKLI